jgi:hypothetical protein
LKGNFPGCDLRFIADFEGSISGNACVPWQWVSEPSSTSTLNTDQPKGVDHEDSIRASGDHGVVADHARRRDRCRPEVDVIMERRDQPSQAKWV